jgi:hypothetical protein
MTIYVSNPVTGPVVGQPISPSFGVQFAGALPATLAGIGFGVAAPPNMPIIEALSRGVLPRNQNVSSVTGVSTGAQNPTPIADMCSNGCGNQVNCGVSVVPAVIGGGNGANDQQVFVGGIGITGPGFSSPNAPISNGPTATNVETLTSAPVSVNTNCGNLGLTANSFQG